MQIRRGIVPLRVLVVAASIAWAAGIVLAGYSSATYRQPERPRRLGICCVSG